MNAVPILTRSRLGRRFLAGLLGVLLICSAIFLIAFVIVYRSVLIGQQARDAEQVSQLLQAALENAMLKRDLDGLKAIVVRLGEHPDITSVMILNPDGEIRFASRPDAVGGRLAVERAGGVPVESVGFAIDAGGREVLRAVRPVANKPECGTCHGPKSVHPVNGILVIDHDASHIRAEALKGAAALVIAGVIVLGAMLAALAYLLRHHVLLPVRGLSETTRRFAAGDLTARVPSGRDDELGDLGRHFNRMAGDLAGSIDRITRSEAFLQSLIDAIPDGIRVIGPDFRILKANAAFHDLVRLAPGLAVGRRCHAISHSLDEPCSPTLTTCPMVELEKGGVRLKCQQRFVRADGSELFVEVTAARLPAEWLDAGEGIVFVESIRDLAEQAKLSHEQRLSELGQLATGIAHEIYNPLSSIDLALKAIQSDLHSLDLPSEVEENLGVVAREIARCQMLTNRLLRLSEPAEGGNMLVDVRATVEDTVALLAYQADHAGVRLEARIDNAPRVVAAESDLGIVLVNLIQNAIHAMPGGGTLKVGVTETPRQVTITVADTGVGIAHEDLHRIFWPFWSRRADDSHGTGLGLSICRAAIERMGGAIEVASVVGRGTTFTVRLPSAEAQLEAMT